VEERALRALARTVAGVVSVRIAHDPPGATGRPTTAEPAAAVDASA
jgi:hypothetical protein